MGGSKQGTLRSAMTRASSPSSTGKKNSSSTKASKVRSIRIYVSCAFALTTGLDMALIVPPADLEGVLITHPEIADAGVIGVDSVEEATELPRFAFSLPLMPCFLFLTHRLHGIVPTSFPQRTRSSSAHPLHTHARAPLSRSKFKTGSRPRLRSTSSYEAAWSLLTRYPRVLRARS